MNGTADLMDDHTTGPSPGGTRVLLLPYAYQATVLGRRCRTGRKVTLRDSVPVSVRLVDAAHAPVAVHLRRRIGGEAGAGNGRHTEYVWRRFSERLFRRIGFVGAVSAERREADLRRSDAERDDGSGASRWWETRDYPIRSLPTDQSPNRPAFQLPTLESLSLHPLRGPFLEQDSDRPVRRDRAAAHLAEALITVDGEIWLSSCREASPHWMIVADRFASCVRVELRWHPPGAGEGGRRFSIERLPGALAHAAALAGSWEVRGWPIACDAEVVQVHPDELVDDVWACALDALAAIDGSAQVQVEERWRADAAEAFARLVVLQGSLRDPSPPDIVRILQAFVAVAEGSKRRVAAGSAADRMANLARDVAWRWTLTERHARPDLAALWHAVAREEALIAARDAAALAALAP